MANPDLINIRDTALVFLFLPSTRYRACRFRQYRGTCCGHESCGAEKKAAAPYTAEVS